MEKATRQRVLALRGLFLFIWMGVIFWFSSKPGIGDSVQSSWSYILERKSAHVFEYAVLLFFAFRYFWIYFSRESFARIISLSAFLAVAYGAADELHQFFIPGRGAHFRDVVIDGLGVGLMACLLYFFFEHSRKKSSS